MKGYKMTTKEKIEVMQAYTRGEEIVCKSSRDIANPEVWCVGSPMIEGIDPDDFIKRV